MQVKLTVARVFAGSIGPGIVAVNSASPRRTVQLGKQEAPKSHEVGETKPENKRIEKKLNETRQAEKKRSDEIEKEITQSE